MTDPYGMPPATPDTVHPHDIVDRVNPDSYHLFTDHVVAWGGALPAAVQAQMRTVPWRER